MSYIEKEKLIKADIASIENRVRHAFNQGYDLGFKDGKERANPQESRKGRWIVNAPQYDMLNPQYICSECGNAHTRTTPYCERCGAKMIEPQESEG